MLRCCWLAFAADRLTFGVLQGCRASACVRGQLGWFLGDGGGLKVAALPACVRWGSRIFFLPRVFHVAPFRGKEYNKFRFQSERAEVTVRVQASMKILDSYTLVHFDGWRNPITLVGKHLERHGSL